LPYSTDVFESDRIAAESARLASEAGAKIIVLENQDKNSGQTTEAIRQRFLAPDRLVPIDGKIADELKNILPDGITPLEKARAIYDHVAGHDERRQIRRRLGRRRHDLRL
jgi:hypothetical protein